MIKKWFCLFQDSNNRTRFQAVDSDFSTNTNYTHYYKVWSNLIVTTVIPLSVLIFCNVGIFVTLRKSRKSMFGVSNQRRQTVQQKNENGLAIILVGIVLVFMVCHASRFFLAFYHVSVTSFKAFSPSSIEQKHIYPLFPRYPFLRLLRNVSNPNPGTRNPNLRNGFTSWAPSTTWCWWSIPRWISWSIVQSDPDFGMLWPVDCLIEAVAVTPWPWGLKTIRRNRPQESPQPYQPILWICHRNRRHKKRLSWLWPTEMEPWEDHPWA